MDSLTSATISSTAPANPASDFNFLRREGIKNIQQLAGTTWTDHNTHDPGITILDQLCYAITDISYRLDYDIRDLLATETGDPYKSLFSPAEILTVGPVTLNDLRKLILDVEGVKNAWIEKPTDLRPALYYYPDDGTLNLFENEEKRSGQIFLKGVYRVLIEMESFAGSSSAVLNDVAGRLHSCRSLCEDFGEIKVLDEVKVTVSGTVEIGQTDDLDKLAAGILFRIARFISPRLRFYTLTEMLQKGKDIDEIFEGPALAHGFIDDDELSSFTRKTALHTSDIIREIMDEPGVSYVSNIGMSLSNTESGQNWFLAIEDGKTPAIDFNDKSSQVMNLQFVKRGVKLIPDINRVVKLFNALITDPHKRPLKPEDRNIVPEPGTFRHTNAYFSIQNHFPQVYGIGEAGLPDSASPLRKSQARQLKAYLLLFEQILANYQAQTAGLKRLFSFFNHDPHTYFYRSLVNAVPGAEDIFADDQGVTDQKIASFTESMDEAVSRKSRLLDHLLARFGESATKYALYLQSYQTSHPNKEGPDVASQARQYDLKTLVEDKLGFLADYPRLSSDRNKAFDYREKSWRTDNVSGLEKRIAAKLGIRNCTRRRLAGSPHAGEGFHLLEHILLRPVQEDLDVLTPYCLPHDITSFEPAGERYVRCISAAHGLQSGDRVIINKSNSVNGTYNGMFTIANVLPDSFDIETVFHVPAGAPGTAQWKRDVQYSYASILTFSKPVTGFAPKGNDPLTTVCTAPSHGLANGDTVKITGAGNYNGTYAVSNVAAGLFEIPKEFTPQEAAGRFVKTDTDPDPYSLQFTCMFPDWTGRFVDKNFRLFVEDTIREETPAHLTAYVRWLNEPDMKSFETFFRLFLAKLENP